MFGKKKIFRKKNFGKKLISPKKIFRKNFRKNLKVRRFCVINYRREMLIIIIVYDIVNKYYMI